MNLKKKEEINQESGDRIQNSKIRRQNSGGFVSKLIARSKLDGADLIHFKDVVNFQSGSGSTVKITLKS